MKSSIALPGYLLHGLPPVIVRMKMITCFRLILRSVLQCQLAIEMLKYSTDLI